MSSAALESLKPEVDAFSEKLAAVQREVGRVVVGQQYMVERLLLAHRRRPYPPRRTPRVSQRPRR